MRQSSRTSSFIGLALGLTILILIGTGFAGNPAKTYPEQGKVIANGTIGPTLGQTTIYTHVYEVETDKAVFVLDCGKKPFFSRRGGECGGDQKIQIGDLLHFRIEKNWAPTSPLWTAALQANRNSAF